MDVWWQLPSWRGYLTLVSYMSRITVDIDNQKSIGKSSCCHREHFSNITIMLNVDKPEPAPWQSVTTCLVHCIYTLTSTQTCNGLQRKKYCYCLVLFVYMQPWLPDVFLQHPLGKEKLPKLAWAGGTAPGPRASPVYIFVANQQQQPRQQHTSQLASTRR